MSYQIELKNLIKVFGPRIDEAVKRLEQGQSKTTVQEATGAIVGLAGVNASFKKGEISCVMGLSGSGKSTLIRHINRLIDPTHGEILIDGENILQYTLDELREFRRTKISMVFQGFALLPHLTILENVAFGLKVRKDPVSRSKEFATQWIERVGLTGYAKHYPDELSGGMKQRVGLARALATESEILLMDEAFSALDPLIRADLQDQLIDLQKKLSKTIVFVTHDLEEAVKLGQHLVILKDGKVVQAGSPQEIITAPADEYVARFVSKSSLLHTAQP